MELLKVTQENIDKMVRKGLNAQTREFQPDEFTDYSSICSEDLIITTIRVLSSLSGKLGLADNFITDFVYPLSQYTGEDMGANRLKFIVFTLLTLDKEESNDKRNC